MKLSPNALAAAIGISATSLAIYSGYAKLAATDAKIASFQSEIAALKGTKANVKQAETARLLRADRILVPEDIDTFGLVDQELSMNLLSSHDPSPPGLTTLEGEANGKAGKASPGGQTSSTSPTYVGKSGKGGKMSSGTTRAVCYSDGSREIETSVVKTSALDVSEFSGSFDWTTLAVGTGQDILVDLTATTGTFWFSGNDYSAETLQLVGETPADIDDWTYPSWAAAMEAIVRMGVELIAPDNSVIRAVPQAMVTLSSNLDAHHLQQDDWDTDDGYYFLHNDTETHSAKFFFPNLAAGDYKLRVKVFVRSASELIIIGDDAFAVFGKVVLGSHVLVAEVVDSADGQCTTPLGQVTNEQVAFAGNPAAMNGDKGDKKPKNPEN